MAQDIALKIDNRYEVLGELGRGGMGIVYKANDLKMDRLVAIKVMTSHAVGRDEYQERFLREARSIAKMQHPNIVVVHDYGYHDGNPYMAMEYVEGIPLDKVIASRVNITPLAKVDYIVQVCHALHYAHQQGIVHRDVKPGNIMLLEGGKRVKLLDFGIARAGGASNLSKSGLAMGTTCYMSPEQTKGQKDLDGRADIFSAGVVLYELLAGKPPWTGDSDYEIMTKIIHDPFPPLSGVNNYPQVLDHIFERALAKDPKARYQTAEQMAQELSELEAPLKEQALEEALIQFENGDLLRANDLVSQILRIDTRHREAIELQGKLQQVAQLQQRSDQVRQLRNAAEQAIGQKRYTEALSAVEQAISIDSANTELFHYRELIRHEVKRREDIRKKLELAKRAQEINDLSTAEELVDKALEADPTDTQARMMKSRLEEERKRQQQQELAEEASRALAVRAFVRAREFIQQLEVLGPAFTPLASLKQALQEGEAEEKRRVEIENLIRDIRRVLESGDVAQSLAVTEQALARFPAEPRLVRVRAQAEALRDAAERERAIQEKIALVKKLTEKGQNAEALTTAESAVIRLGADHRLQALLPQLRQAVERERQLQAQQAVLTQARNAIQAEDFEFAHKILAAALVEFPDSREIADALQAAQAGIASRTEAAKRERQVQAEQATLAQARNAMQAANFESALKILTAARIEFPNSKEIAEALQAARAGSVRKAEAVERDRRAQAEQAALAQAGSAMQAADFESALKILAAARIDFPNSKELTAALQAAQAALAKKDELEAERARKREIVESLERALASEPDPELQVRLAEEAVRRIPGNEAAERVLARVRDWHRQFASAVARARDFEQTQRYPEAIQEWERIRQFWPQHPQVNAQIVRLNAAAKAAAVAKPPSPAPGFSATSIMAAAPRMAPAPPPAPTAPQSVQMTPAPPAPPEVRRTTPAPTESVAPTVAQAVRASVDQTVAQPGQPAERSDLTELFRNKKLIGIAGTVGVVILGVVLYAALHRNAKNPAGPIVVNPTPVTTPSAPPIPSRGTITIQTDVDQAEVWVDGSLQTTTDRKKATVTVTSGSHTIAVKKTGYEVTPAIPQPVKVDKDQESTLRFTLKKTTETAEAPADTYLVIKARAGAQITLDGNPAGQVSADNSVTIKTTPGKHRVALTLEGYTAWSNNKVSAKAGERATVNAELKAIPKAEPVIAFSATPTSIQQGATVQMKWDVQNATEVTIDQGIGPVRPRDSISVKPSGTVTYTLTAKGDGGTQIAKVPITVSEIPKPIISSFDAGATSIQLGRSVKLFWSSQNATEGYITDVGKVAAQGPIEVTPTKSTTYILTVKGPGGTSEPRTAQVMVESAPTPVTPAPVVAATPPPAPTPIPVDPEIKAVKDTIEVRYKNALESMVIDEVRKVWLALPKDDEKSTKESFSVAKAVRVTFACGTPKIQGDSAECSCSETLTYTIGNKVQSPQKTRVSYQLKKNTGNWYIASSRVGK